MGCLMGTNDEAVSPRRQSWWDGSWAEVRAGLPDRVRPAIRTAVDYFRRAPRPEELFFVFDRDGVRNVIKTFLASPAGAQ